MWFWVPMHKRPHFLQKRLRKYGVNSGEADDDLSSFFLSEPKKDHLDLENKIFPFGVEAGHASMQGLRASMEDRHIIAACDIDGHVLVAIFDGHAGVSTADYAAEHFQKTLQATKQWREYKQLKTLKDRQTHINLVGEALVQAFVTIDEELRKIMVEEDPDEMSSDVIDISGSAANICVITPSHVVCGNLGDSRSVFVSGDKVIGLSEDHKPENPEEQKRIHKAGGFVLMNRVDGQLAMSRALGDFNYKVDPDLTDKEYKVIAYPDISVQERSSTTPSVLVVACDGVWDVCDGGEVGNFVTEVLNDVVDGQPAGEVSAQTVSERLIDWALERESTDNISAVVVKLNSVATTPTAALHVDEKKRRRESEVGEEDGKHVKKSKK